MTVAMKVRWLAGVTGCATLLAGSLTFGLEFLVVPSPLIVGAVVAGRWERTGTQLMWAGAVFMSLWVLPYGVLVLLPKSGPSPGALVISIAAVVVSLVILCDAVLVMDAVRTRKKKAA